MVYFQFSHRMSSVRINYVTLTYLLITICACCAMEEWETWPLDKLEKEVSPSKWNSGKLPDQVIKQYVDISIQGTLKAQMTVPHELDVQYGEKPSQRYDVYGTDLPPDAPIYVWIHGGYWQEGSKDIAGILAVSLHSKGVRNIVVGYTLATSGATLSEIEGEIVSALNDVVKRYPDTTSLTVGGHSAGAQLTAMLLHTDKDLGQITEKLQALHLVSGIYDLRPLVPTSVNSPIGLTRSSAEASSPLLKSIRQDVQEKGSSLKISITVGEHDSNLFKQQSQDYYQRLKQVFPNTKFWKADGDDHFTLVENMANSESPAGQQLTHFAEEVKETTSGQRSLPLPAISVLVAVTSALLRYYS